MTTEVLIPWITPQFFANSGQFLAGGQLFSYQAGTVIPAVTYTDSTGLTANPNPVIANSRGEMSVWIPANVSYKFVLEDSAGNTIWTRDQVANAQLLTLFGGVDTGAVNAYLLTFASNFTAYANGIVIYFIAANTNTGPSTLNVNGLGVVPIVNQNGAALTAGQIIAGQMVGVAYYNGNWLLILAPAQFPQQGTFTGTFQGFASIGPFTVSYSINGITVNINLPYFSSTSNSTSFSMTGVPTALQPVSTKLVPLAVVSNNGALVTTGAASIGANTGTGTIVFLNNAVIAGWSATGTKGIGIPAIFPFTGGAGDTLVYNQL
jgi:hypothetical protein